MLEIPDAKPTEPPRICPNCAYDNLESPSNRCPECGLTLNVDTLVDIRRESSKISFTIAVASGLLMFVVLRTMAPFAQRAARDEIYYKCWEVWAMPAVYGVLILTISKMTVYYFTSSRWPMIHHRRQRKCLLTLLMPLLVACKLCLDAVLS